MKGDKPRPKVVSFEPQARQLEARVRELAADSQNILWSDHARDRMEERGIFPEDVLRMLRVGFMRGSPDKTEFGEWKLKMVNKIKGAREAGAVTIILVDGRLFIKTVEWEDPR